MRDNFIKLRKVYRDTDSNDLNKGKRQFMKAEDLLKVVEKDSGEYAGVKREDIDYSLKRNQAMENYLKEVGPVSKSINDGLKEIKSKGVSK